MTSKHAFHFILVPKITGTYLDRCCNQHFDNKTEKKQSHCQYTFANELWKNFVRSFVKRTMKKLCWSSMKRTMGKLN